MPVRVTVSDEVVTKRRTALEKGSSGRLSRKQVMRDIQEFLVATFRFGVNPLPALRKQFPYEWTSYPSGMFLNRSPYFHNLLGTSRFIWLIPDETGWGGTLVVARECGTPKDLSKPNLDMSALREDRQPVIVWRGERQDGIFFEFDQMRAVIIPELRKPSEEGHIAPDDKPAPFGVGDKVVVTGRLPLHSPDYFCSFGHGTINHRKPLRVKDIWWLFTEYLMTIEGVGGVWYEKDFVPA